MEPDLYALEKRLQRRGYQTAVLEDRRAAAQYILDTFAVNGETTVGMGNSMTLEALQIKAFLAGKAGAVYQHAPGSDAQETRRALLADLYLTSVNALSADGQIVNIDGTGNRVAATCYGPRQVVFVIGKNKVAPSLEAALDRARNTAAVQNAKRYNRKTPCVTTGKCEDCLSPDCICSVMAIHRRCPNGMQATVLLVNEALGL